MIKIHALQTGRVRIKQSQMERALGGPLRVLFDPEWSEWLPIHAWVIEHPEGIVVVDTGETARVNTPGYHPSWHPFHRRATAFDLRPEEEIGAQLKAMGIHPYDVGTVILTHLHTDHSGGLHHFPKSRILVARGEYREATGFLGKINGYLPHRWPGWFAPEPISFAPIAQGPFAASYAVTSDGAVMVVPTPGHTPHHVSVIVHIDGVNYFLAGDASYSEAQLLQRRADGITLSPKTAVTTLEKIQEYVSSRPTVYLPSHDPASVDRLWERQVTKPRPRARPDASGAVEACAAGV
jgi:glyoxylase-like metal-dependent hydrolase (beta-lactamase superfamily II)